MMINLHDIWDARRQISGYIHHTQMLHSSSLSRMFEADVYLKCENLQKTGSFKVRGAFNHILSLTDEQKKAGVVCYSNGNHAQAVSYAASLLGVESWVVMPENATPAKVAACKEYGGHIILHGQSGADTYPKAIELMNEKGLAYIDPCEDEKIMAGQGTIGLEMLEALPDADVVYVPVGGGGLISGIATAVKELSPKAKVVGVEPERMNCMTASVKAGKIVKIARQTSIADGLSGAAPGINAFTVVQKYVDDMLTVSEAEIAEATLLVMQRTKMFIEPSASATVAGLFSKRSFHGKKNICLLSGGNANLKVLAELFLKNN
jgi:threonine dehydratase